ncbi:MAG: hypothetical protein ACKOX2_11450, partial [Microcystaceae cyanobacterium]
MIQGLSRRLRLKKSLERSILAFILFFGLISYGLVGCLPQASPPIASDTRHITIGTVLKPRTIDPADSYDLAGLMVVYNLGETLYTYQLGTTTLIPQLAQAMPTLSADGLTYTIPLRSGVKFH